MASIIRSTSLLSAVMTAQYGCSITSPHSRANTNDRILKALELLIGRFGKYFYTIPFTHLFGKSYFIVSSAAIWDNSTSAENYYVNQAPVYLN
jgi:hypothetical protein